MGKLYLQLIPFLLQETHFTLKIILSFMGTTINDLGGVEEIEKKCNPPQIINGWPLYTQNARLSKSCQSHCHSDNFVVVTQKLSKSSGLTTKKLSKWQPKVGTCFGNPESKGCHLRLSKLSKGCQNMTTHELSL